jgi:hypothetical protein
MYMSAQRLEQKLFPAYFSTLWPASALPQLAQVFAPKIVSNMQFTDNMYYAPGG